MHRKHRTVAWGVGAAVWFSQPRAAHSFRCTQAAGDSLTADAPSLSWRTRQLTYSLQPAASKHLPVDATLQVLRSAFGVWQQQTLNAKIESSCTAVATGTDITFTELPANPDVDWVGYNFLAPQTNTNLLVFRDDHWPPQDPTASDIIALSTITYSAITGEIIDADIEFNSANFAFSAADPNDQQMDLLSTAVHEIGHFLGLAHCSNSGSCGNNEVMEPTANLGEFDKRTLQCDDLMGLVFKYPKNAANGYATKVASLSAASLGSGTCLPPQESLQRPVVRQLSHDAERSGCQQGPRTAERLGALPWLVLCLGLMMWRRRNKKGRGKVALPLGALALLLLCQCSGGGLCGADSHPPIDARAPLILAMDLVGQVDIDPWHVVLEADVTDGDGDLGRGTVDYYVNGSSTAAESQNLERVFDASGGVPTGSTDALLQLLLRFSRSTANTAYLHLGTQMTDEAGHKSNCYHLDLSYILGAMNG